MILVGFGHLYLSFIHVSQFFAWQYLRKESVEILDFFPIEMVIKEK